MPKSTQTFNGKEYHLYPGEKYFSRGNNKLHRVVWEFYNGKIPEGYQVHHKDHNAYNNDISNLECISEEEHIRKHKMEIEQSKTQVIKRSRINLNPLNPKRHTEQAIALQKKNLRKVGYLGGVVWNEQTGNLIDGHRRVHAMDAIMKYDGTPETDYDIKVEIVHLDPKTEKEQMTYMAVGDTQADLDLIAKYIGDIDYSDVGLDDKRLNEVLAMTSVADDLPDLMDDFLSDTSEAIAEYKQMTEAEDAPQKKDVLPTSVQTTAQSVSRPPLTAEERKEAVKEAKRQQQEKAVTTQRNNDAYIVLSFSSYDTYEAFCETTGIALGEKYVKGEDVLAMLE